MAEIGLIASVIQVAGAGLKLSQTLYQYADTVASADRKVRDIAKEIQLTSFVVSELGDIFKQDQTSSLLSKNALRTADETIQECSSVFTELDVTIKKTKKNALGRLILPFRESKIEILRSHIDKLKTTLQLLMQVLTHAHQVASQKLDREAEAVQREHIKALLEKKHASAKRYEESLKNYASDDEGEPDDSTVISQGGSAASVAQIETTMTTTNLEICVQHLQTLLEDIETLQQTLSTAEDAATSSAYHQTLMGSYFRAREHLDSVLLGNPQTLDNDSGSGTSTERRVKDWDIQRALPGSTLTAAESHIPGTTETIARSKGRFITNAEIKKITEEATERGRREERAKLALEFEKKEHEARLKAEELRAKAKLEDEAKKMAREELVRQKMKAAKAAHEQTMKAMEESQMKGDKVENDKRAAEQAAEQAAAERAAQLKTQSPVEFKDAIGRKFRFPFHVCNTWTQIHGLMQEAFLKVDSLNEHVKAGRYDLIGPTGETIPPELYGTLVQPGWTVTMRMQPLPGLLPSPSLRMRSRSPASEKTSTPEGEIQIQDPTPGYRKQSTMSPRGGDRMKTPSEVSSAETPHLRSPHTQSPSDTRPQGPLSPGYIPTSPNPQLAPTSSNYRPTSPAYSPAQKSSHYSLPPVSQNHDSDIPSATYESTPKQSKSDTPEQHPGQTDPVQSYGSEYEYSSSGDEQHTHLSMPPPTLKEPGSTTTADHLVESQSSLDTSRGGERESMVNPDQVFGDEDVVLSPRTPRQAFVEDYDSDAENPDISTVGNRVWDSQPKGHPSVVSEASSATSSQMRTAGEHRDSVDGGHIRESPVSHNDEFVQRKKDSASSDRRSHITTPPLSSDLENDDKTERPRHTTSIENHTGSTVTKKRLSPDLVIQETESKYDNEEWCSDSSIAIKDRTKKVKDVDDSEAQEFKNNDRVGRSAPSISIENVVDSTITRTSSSPDQAVGEPRDDRSYISDIRPPDFPFRTPAKIGKKIKRLKKPKPNPEFSDEETPEIHDGENTPWDFDNPNDEPMIVKVEDSATSRLAASHTRPTVHGTQKTEEIKKSVTSSNIENNNELSDQYIKGQDWETPLSPSSSFHIPMELTQETKRPHIPVLLDEAERPASVHNRNHVHSSVLGTHNPSNDTSHSPEVYSYPHKGSKKIDTTRSDHNQDTPGSTTKNSQHDHSEMSESEAGGVSVLDPYYGDTHRVVEEPQYASEYSNSEGAKTPTLQSHAKNLIEYSDEEDWEHDATPRKEGRSAGVHEKDSQPTSNSKTRYYSYLTDHSDVHPSARTSKSAPRHKESTVTRHKSRISSASPRPRIRTHTPEGSHEKTKSDRGRRRPHEKEEPEGRGRYLTHREHTSPQPDMSSALVLRNPPSAMKKHTRTELPDARFPHDEWSLTRIAPSDRQRRYQEGSDDDWGDFSAIEDRANREKARSKALAFAHGAKRRVHARETHERSQSRKTKTPVRSPSPQTRTRADDRRRHPDDERQQARYERGERRIRTETRSPIARNDGARDMDLVRYIPASTRRENEVDDLLRDWTTVWD